MKVYFGSVALLNKNQTAKDRAESANNERTQLTLNLLMKVLFLKCRKSSITLSIAPALECVKAEAEYMYL